MSVQRLRAIYSAAPQWVQELSMCLVAISHCWLSPQHPDPDAISMSVLAAKLRVDITMYQKHYEDMGIFWDWVSMYQEHGGNSGRTREQYDSFKRALHETMDLWFAHQRTVVYMLTELPPGSLRSHGYSASGWTTFERCSAELTKPSMAVRWHSDGSGTPLWPMCVDLGRRTGKEHTRNLPMAPCDFANIVATKVFTNAADSSDVLQLYEKVSTSVLEGIRVLDLSGVRISLGGGPQLANCLRHCKRLSKLQLRSCGLTSDEFEAILHASSFLTNLRIFHLIDNNLDDRAISLLVSRCGNGAFPQLRRLSFFGNQITKDGVRILIQGIQARVFKSLEELFMGGNSLVLRYNHQDPLYVACRSNGIKLC